MSWNYFSSSVTGTSHFSTATPCQDKHLVLTSSDGKWLAAVVSDGAGSAKYAETGAENTVKIFAEALVSLSSVLDTRAPGTWINDYLIEKILKLRQTLRDVAGKDEINEYHCTLVAALVGERGGFSIHIGDGHITGGNFELLNDGKINLNSANIISLPENGEYANETFFITEGNWVKHIRVSPLPAVDWITLTSDGGSSLLFDGNDNVKPGFLIPILGFAIDEPQSASKFLTTTISDSKANHLTSDDKTIVIAYKKNKILSSEKIIYKEQEKISNIEKNYSTQTTSSASKQPIEKISTINLENELNKKKFNTSIFKTIAKYIAIFSIGVLSIYLGFFLQQKYDNSIKNSSVTQANGNQKKEAVEATPPSTMQPASNSNSPIKENNKDTQTTTVQSNSATPANSASGQLEKVPAK